MSFGMLGRRVPLWFAQQDDEMSMREGDFWTLAEEFSNPLFFRYGPVKTPRQRYWIARARKKRDEEEIAKMRATQTLPPPTWPPVGRPKPGLQGTESLGPPSTDLGDLALYGGLAIAAIWGLTQIL